MFKTLQRYVLFDFAKTFLLALVVLTLIFFLGTSLRVVMRFKDMDLDFLLQIVPAMVAGTLSLTVPTSVLAACTLTFSRLSHDNEITAMKACGIHLGTIVRPVLLAGALASLMAFYLGATVVPDAQYRARILASRAIDEVLTSAVSDDPSTIDFFDNYRLHYGGYDKATETFHDLVIHHVTESAGLSQEIMARRGRLVFGPGRVTMELEDGSLAYIRSQPRDVGSGRQRLRGGQERDQNWAEYEIEHYRRKTSWVGFERYEMVVELDAARSIRLRPRYLPLTGPSVRQRALSPEARADEKLDESLRVKIRELQDLTLYYIENGRKSVERSRADHDRVIAALEKGDVAVAKTLRAEARAFRETELPQIEARLKAAEGDESLDGLIAREQAESDRNTQLGHAQWQERMAAAIEAGDKAQLPALRAHASRLGPELDWHEKQIEKRTEDLRKFRIEEQKRYSLPLCCLIVVLLGAPLGILVRHSNKLVAFGISAIPVFGLYYPILMVAENLAEDGKVPVWTIQSPNLIVGALGLVLLWKVYRQ